MSKPERRDYAACLLAVGDEPFLVETLRRKAHLTYSQAYERIKVMVKAEVVRVVRRGGTGRPAMYQVCMPFERALEVLSVPVVPVDSWVALELDRAWPAPVLSRVGR